MKFKKPSIQFYKNFAKFLIIYFILTIVFDYFFKWNEEPFLSKKYCITLLINSLLFSMFFTLIFIPYLNKKKEPKKQSNN